jgi:hypothetical protein
VLVVVVDLDPVFRQGLRLDHLADVERELPERAGAARMLEQRFHAEVNRRDIRFVGYRFAGEAV